MNSKYSTISKQTIDINPYWNYVIEEYILPDFNIGKYYYVESNGSTIIIPKLSNGNFLLTKQFRYLNKKFSLEFPGGGIKKGLLPLQNAYEELQQETGLVARKWTPIGKFNPCNGMTNEICQVYLAEELSIGIQNPDSSEEIDVLELSFKEINEKIKMGEIWDGMTLASWSLYFLFSS